MARPDTSNAQVRKPRGRRDTTKVADEAQRLLDDPAFERAYTLAREQLISHIESLPASGHAEDIELERELCRTLRSLKGVRRVLVTTVQGEKLRLADFQAQQQSDEGD